MKERGSHQPGDERSVLHGIPGPESTPAKLDVGPPGANEDSGSQRGPGEQAPTARSGEPVARKTPAAQGGERGGKRNRVRGIPEEEDRRMQHHPHILKEREHADPFFRRHREDAKRVAGYKEDKREERLAGQQSEDQIRSCRIRSVPPLDRDEGNDRQQPEPQQERTCLARPEGGNAIEGREVCACVPVDVQDLKLV